MIKAFYNLKTLPFQKDIKPEDIFLSAASKELFQRLEYMKQNRGIMMITGMPRTRDRKNTAPAIFCANT